MSSSVIQVTPSTRELCRKRLEKVCDETLAREIEQCIWTWSRGQNVVTLSAPAPQKHIKPPAPKKKKAAPKSQSQQPQANPSSGPEFLPPSDWHIQYETKFKQLVHNLQLNGSHLLQKYPPDALVWLDDPTLAAGTKYATLQSESTEAGKRLEKILETASNEVPVPQALKLTETSTPTFLRCRKCKSTNIEFDQKQIRSGDEGMTAFCKCKDCDTTWKM